MSTAIALPETLDLKASGPLKQAFVERRGQDIEIHADQVRRLGRGRQTLFDHRAFRGVRGNHPSVRGRRGPAADRTARSCIVTRTVLTVDDSRTMRDMLRMALAGAGFNVVEAVDGEHGLEVLS